MALQWFYNPPCTRALKSPWDTQFGWCKKGIAQDPFPLPCPRRNANHQNLSFQTFEKVFPSLVKACPYYYELGWDHQCKQQWKTWHLPLAEHTH